MKKIKVTVAFIIAACGLYAQNIQDTIDNPIWMDMWHSNSNFYKTKRAYDLFFSNKEKIKGSGYKQFERWADNAVHYIDENGNFKQADFLLKEFQKFQRNNLTPRGTLPKWTALGPFNNPSPASMQRGVGRVAVIAYHPTDENILYAGAPAGGFWISNDKGQNWINSNTDNLPSFGVSAIAVIPVPNSTPIILVGTGDRDANDAPGLGVYVSYDGGINFEESNTGMGNVVVNKLLVNPMNNEIIIAATSNGIYKSYNSGQNWIKTSSVSDYKDIQFHPTDTNYLYASAGGTFYRSTNGGNTWNFINTGFSNAGKRRMVIGVTAANPDLVYVLTCRNSASDYGMEGFYKSTDKGNSFSLQLSGTSYNPLGFNASGNGTGGQGYYDIAIETSPTDENVVYVGGINIFKSTNGGKSFSCIAFWSYSPTLPWVHADIHYLGRNPLNNEIYVGSDGGIDYTVNEGTSFNNRNNNLAISMFYNLGVSQKSLTKFITGAQDNGTSAGSSKEYWQAELAGDGMQCEISNFDTTVMFGSLYYGDIQRTVNGGQSWKRISNSITETGPWETPFHIHPNVDNIMVTVFNNIWISKNVITTNNPSFIKATSGITASGSALRFSNTDNNYVFAGWNNGNLMKSSNILASNPSFTNMKKTNITAGKINDIETDYRDVNILYVAVNNKIYKTIDLGENWSDISLNLPNINVNCIALDKYSSEGLYVGTDAGVYYKDSSMSNWILYSNGLSLNAQIRDLEIVYDETCHGNSKLFAATYGRGLWVVNVNEKTSTFELMSDITDSICQGNKVSVTLSGGSNYTFENNPYGIISKINEGIYEIIPNSSGQYIFYSQPSSNECDVKYLDIDVKPKPNINLSISSKTINFGDSISVSAYGANDYEWSPTQYILGSNTDATVEVKPEETITYTVKGKGPNGCEDQKEIKITVKSSSSISHTMHSEIKIYPNPSSDKLIIQSSEKIKFALMGIGGRKILTSEKFQSIHTIDVSSVNIGHYIILLEDINGSLKEYKVTINR